eukprot:2745767-Rhodomonas_salina.1
MRGRGRKSFVCALCNMTIRMVAGRWDLAIVGRQRSSCSPDLEEDQNGRQISVQGAGYDVVRCLRVSGLGKRSSTDFESNPTAACGTAVSEIGIEKLSCELGSCSELNWRSMEPCAGAGTMEAKGRRGA